MRKPTFLTGLALGYVLGTRAGRERYEQIRKASHMITQTPAVQSAARTATHAAGSAAHTAAHTLVEKIGHRLRPTTHERLSHVRDRTAVYRTGDAVAWSDTAGNEG
ncbi:YtxH domain-containing protein [Streptacidiphilus sp. PAMC 29251]